VNEDDAAQRCYLPEEWLAEADIPPGEADETALPSCAGAAGGAAVRDGKGNTRHRPGSARRRLSFRQRWAVLSAAGIYGAIARNVDAAGDHAWDHRISTSGLAKLGHVAHGLWEAITPPPRTTARPRWGRRELAALARR
jgi:phytoene synthase